jgi:TolB-like protein/Tfp pilus assembly protein PilF
MSFWREVKRRNVFRVAAVYLAVAWLVAQIVSVVSTPLNLPDWFDAAMIVLLAVGFPVALILAWAFELTPDGVKRTSDSADTTPAPASTGRKIGFAIIGILVVALGLALWDRQGPATAPSPIGAAPAVAENSVAVLPFVNLSSDPEQEYFSDGLSEEILNQLVQIEGLQVAGRTSSFLFKDRAAEFKTIGETLGVEHVLEGSVRKADNELRITAQLIKVSDGFHLWSKTYDRKLDDVFAIQEDIAMAVADALSLTLGVGKRGLRYAGTDSFDAYDRFLRGRRLWNGAPERAIEEFTKAAEIDPDYALPWAWMSQSYGFLVQRSRTPTEYDRNFEDMERAARRSVELGPDLWESHNALVWALLAKKDWIGADRAFRRAVTLAREEGARMTIEYPSFLETFGKFDEAVSYLSELRELDPLNRENSIFLQNALAIQGRYEDVLAEEARIGLPEDGFRPSYVFGFPWFFERGEASKVRAAFARAPEGSISRQFSEVLDSRDDALAMIREWLASPGFKTRNELSEFALFAGYYGDTDLATRLVREAYLGGGWGAYFIMWHAALSETRRTPEFKTFLRELGFVDLWRETGEWNEYCHPIGGDDFECI